MKSSVLLLLPLCFLLFVICAFPQETKTVTTRSSINQPAKSVKNPELRDEILQRLKSDQAIRIEVVKNYPPGKPLPGEVIERFKAIDKENTARMKEIVKQYGYPGYSLVGENAAQAAFIMI